MHSKVIAAYRETPIKSLTWWAEPKFVQTWKYNFLLCFGNEPPIWYNGLKFTISHVLRYNHTWCVHCWTRIGHLVPETNLFHAPDSIMSCMSHVLWIACSSFKYWMVAWVIVGHWGESNVVQLQLKQVVKYQGGGLYLCFCNQPPAAAAAMKLQSSTGIGQKSSCKKYRTTSLMRCGLPIALHCIALWWAYSTSLL